MAYRTPSYQRPAQLGGLKKILRKIAGPAAAAAAVASGNPQLAVAAYSAGSAATKKKAKAPVYVEPPVAPGLFDNLLPSDRNALAIGGAIVGTLVLSKFLFGGRKR